MYPCLIVLINVFRLLLVFVMPIGIENIGWKMYMINASWDIIIIVLIVSSRSTISAFLADHVIPQAVYWVETKGRTLEEIDAIFEGQKHSAVPDVEAVRKGEATVNLTDLQQEAKSTSIMVEK